MVSFTLTQEKDRVGALGPDSYHEAKGHNTLTADITGTDLDTAWVEFQLDGGGYEDMQKWTESVFKQPLTNAADGVAIDGIDVKEAFDVMWASDAQDQLVMIYAYSEKAYWAESPDGDPTSFQNPTVVIDESGQASDTKVQDPCWLWDPVSETLYVYYEYNDGHGEVAIQEADTREGKSYSNRQLIGGAEWSLGDTFASPSAWIWNDDYYIAGEEHDTPSQNLMVAKGDSPTSWIESRIVLTEKEYPFAVGHLNLQTVYIDKHNRLHGYSNINDGTNYNTHYISTASYDDGFLERPFTLTETTAAGNMASILRLFNQIYVYGIEGSNIGSQISYWKLNGERDDTSVASGGQSVSWEFYEPSLPPGANIDWRVAVQDTDGTVERSATQSFEIVDTDYEWEMSVADIGDAAVGDVTFG